MSFQIPSRLDQSPLIMELLNNPRYKDSPHSETAQNMAMTPEQAVRGLMLMQNYPENMPDIPEDPPYRDLTEFELFKDIEVR